MNNTPNPTQEAQDLLDFVDSIVAAYTRKRRLVEMGIFILGLLLGFIFGLSVR